MKSTVKFLSCLLALAGLVVSANAKADSCLDQSVLQDINSKLKLDLTDKTNFDPCKPETNAYKMMKALSIIRTIKFSAGSLEKPFNGSILPNDFWGYFSERANTIEDETDCPEGVLAFVYGFAMDGVVHICPLFYDDRVSPNERAETMLHEARHFEGYAHVKCKRGLRKGMDGACDDSMDQKGSYAVTVEALTKMALLEQDSPEVERSLTKISALTYADQVFNEPIQPYDMTSIYLKNQDNRAYYFNIGNDLSVRQAPVIDTANNKLLSRWGSLLVFPTDKSNATTLNIFSPTLELLPDVQGQVAANYNKLDQAKRPDMVDIINTDYISGSVAKNHLSFMLAGDTVKTEVDLPWAAKAAFTSPELGRAEDDSVYVLSDKDQFYRVLFKTGKQYEISELPNLSQGFRTFAMFNGKRLGLNEQGAVMVDEKSDGQWKEFAPLQGQRFTFMSRPFLWSSYFEEGGK